MSAPVRVDTAAGPEDEDEAESSVLESEFPSLQDWVEDRAVLYRERARLVQTVCHQEGVANRTSNNSVTDFINRSTKADSVHLVERVRLSQFYLSRPHSLLGCLINKVASSSIVKTFLQLDGLAVKDVRSPHAYASRLHPKVSEVAAVWRADLSISILQSWEELQAAQDGYLKFLIVRDPLERLVSCYKDKAKSSNINGQLCKFYYVIFTAVAKNSDVHALSLRWCPTRTGPWQTSESRSNRGQG